MYSNYTCEKGLNRSCRCAKLMLAYLINKYSADIESVLKNKRMKRSNNIDLKNVFELVIPFRHIGSRDNSESLTTNFQEIHLSNTPQLEGKPILDEKTSPLASVYEIRQAARRTIGFHGNEGHTYILC